MRELSSVPMSASQWLSSGFGRSAAAWREATPEMDWWTQGAKRVTRGEVGARRSAAKLVFMVGFLSDVSSYRNHEAGTGLERKLTGTAAKEVQRVDCSSGMGGEEGDVWDVEMREQERNCVEEDADPELDGDWR